MQIKNKQVKTIDEYIKLFPKDVVLRLKTIREMVNKIAPQAEELISYNMPAFKINKKIFVYFAGFKNHIGFYPYPSAIDAFKEEGAKFKIGKGSIQFPLDKPLPIILITKILKFRLKEVLNKK